MNYSSLTLEKISLSVADKRLINDLELSVAAHKRVALLGLNGAGKSTLIRLLTGENNPDSGSIKFSDGQSEFYPYQTAFKRDLGYQADTMLGIAEMTGRQYLHLCGSFKQLGSSQIESDIKRLTSDWQIASLLPKRLSQLSKGNLQKLSIAQAFLGKPKWLIFDEPCQSLDPVEQSRFNQTIAGLSEFEFCLVSTHNVEHALEIADEIILIHEAQLAHHFNLQQSDRLLLVLKTIDEESLGKLHRDLVQLSIPTESRFARIIKIELTQADNNDEFQKIIAKYSEWVEFILPEKKALMPLFRLLASGELTLLEVKQHSELSAGVSA